MSDTNAEQAVVAFDRHSLERLAAMRSIAATIELLSAFIAPAHIEIGQRKHVQEALMLLVDQIFVEVQARIVSQQGDA